MNTLKLGIVGTGFISESFAEAVSMSDGAEISAVYSRTLEKGTDFAQKFKIPNVYTDYVKLLCSDIDAVYVASPNSLHCSHTVEATKYGKHILCEKPISSNYDEFEYMLSCAKEKKLVLLEAMRPAFDPSYDTVRNLLGKIGKIRHVSLEFCQYSSRYDSFKAGDILRAFNPEYSNAAVMDIGVYPIYMCVSLFGKPLGEIQSKSVILHNGMEGSGEIIIPYGSMSARISYSKICDSVNPSVIIGEDGCIMIDKISFPHKIELKMRNGEKETLPIPKVKNNMIYEIKKFKHLIENNEYDHEYSELSKCTMKIIDEVRSQNQIIFPCDQA